MDLWPDENHILQLLVKVGYGMALVGDPAYDLLVSLGYLDPVQPQAPGQPYRQQFYKSSRVGLRRHTYLESKLQMPTPP